jgi:hypothetical protein
VGFSSLKELTEGAVGFSLLKELTEGAVGFSLLMEQVLYHGLQPRRVLP